MISRIYGGRFAPLVARRLGTHRAPSARILAALLRTLPLLALSSSIMAQSPAPTPSPSGAVPTTAPGGLLITPKNGQTSEQQSADRYECHSWAIKQSGVDPTVAAAGVSPSEQTSRLGSYRRAMSACLDAKGYSVSTSTPPVSAAPPPLPPPPATRADGAPRRVTPASWSEARPQLKYHPFRVQIQGGYNITTGPTDQVLESGAIGGLGVAWFPTSTLPIGLRVDGSYSWFRAKRALLAQYGGAYDRGHEELYGGDADIQLDLAHGASRAKLYLLGGIGWYRTHTELRSVSLVPGFVCGWYDCGYGYFPAVTAQKSMTTSWQQAWNAGLGWEIAVADRASFFIEARYERFKPFNSHMAFVPVTLGFRF
jgi:opacity protein-like surface antigen